MSSRLDRFARAQAQPGAGFAEALDEIARGAKRGHWIWYVFPQLAGLGQSSFSRTYGIDGLPEALDYLRDPVLRDRFLTITRAAAARIDEGVAVERLMGSHIDAQKLVSSLTLFGEAARVLDASEANDDLRDLARLSDSILRAAYAQGLPPCEFTRQALVRRPV